MYPGHSGNIYRDRVNELYQSTGDTWMTNIGDVIRQVETTLCDRSCPPTQEEQERLGRILFLVYSGTVEFRGSM
jgi:hypothetical protein